MSNYKLVPVPPAPKMLQVWKSMYGYSRYDKYKAMLAEAPVINIVATKNEQGQIVSVTLQDGDHRILEVIAEADVQGAPTPDVAGLVGKMGRLIAAGNRLNAEAEECTYDDGMAEVADSEYWCEFRDALEAATEALSAYHKGGEE